MSRKTQKGRQLQGNLHGGCKRRSALAWLLCVALVFGNVWVPGTGIFVQAAEPAISVEENSSEEFSFEDSSSWDATDVLEGDGVSGNAVMALALDSAEDDIAGGTYKDVTWRIDAAGTLTVEGTGDFNGHAGSFNRAPWFDQRESITSAVVRVKGLKNASFMFYGCINLTNVDLSGFDTSSVTDMSCMFAVCTKLTGLDVSGFDTSRVTTMYAMFEYCRSLTSVDVSGFDTSRVTTMYDMFDDCRSLESLDVSGFKTGSVENMNTMFRDCHSLESLDVSNFDTSNVTSMREMFHGCSKLTSLDVSGFDTSNVVGMDGVFHGCSKLTSLDVSGWDTSNVTSMDSMFASCHNLTSLDVSGFKTGSVKNMSAMFGWCSELTSLDLSKFDTSSVTDMSHMFDMSSNDGYSSLTSLDVSNFDTSHVTTMACMFEGCSKLTSLDVSGFDTSNVTTMAWMFRDCRSLESLDLSSFDTSSVTNMSHMFRDCSSLTSLDLSGFDTSSVTTMYEMFEDCSNLTSLNVSSFDTSSVTTTEYMFDSCSSLTSLDVSGFDTSNVTNMYWMFFDCSKLANLDVSGFDTSNVTTMAAMFCYCSSLESLDVSNFDTSSVTSMNNMFASCSNLTSLDVSGFDTSSVTDMRAVFAHCNGLTSVDVSGFDTSSVTNISAMFSGCSNLTSVDVSGFNTSRVTEMDYMFRDCSSLQNLDVSGFDTSSVTSMRYVFNECSNLTSLDLSGFDTSNVTDMAKMFDGCKGLSTLYTPYYVHVSDLDFQPLIATLPAAAATDVWYDADGTTYKTLPENLDHSILLMKNAKPDAAMPSLLIVRLAKSVYELGSSIKPEDLTVRYRGTDGRSIILSPKGDGADTGYTMSDVDMNTPGEKTLTISYNDGTQTLTESVTFRISSLLTDAMVTLLEGEYVYNGQAQEPVPIVKFGAGGTVLTLGTDYTVSYENNTDAGEAALSVKGMNTYSGTVNKTFTIQKASLKDIEVTFSEWCGEAQENRTQNLSGYFNEIAENSGGITAYTVGEVTEHDGAGSVLSGTPSIDGSGILTYSINPGTVGGTVLIPVNVTFAKNYEDARIQVTICLNNKTTAMISGIAMGDATYNGSPVTLQGEAKVRVDDGVEGGAGTDITASVTLLYHYSGTQSDGTVYDSDTAPTHAGNYTLTVTVTDNDFYKGSAEYPFVIRKATLTITASDVALVVGNFTELPDESTLTCEITGLCGSHTAQDVLGTLPAVSYGLNGEIIDKASIAIGKAGSYDLLPSGAVLNQTLGADYEITEQSYRKGALTITKSGSGNPTKPSNPTKPDDPQELKFPDDGKFRVSTVPAQTYTGSAIKPAVTVYCGSRRLTEKTDYTITYKNNTKANDAKTEKTAPTITITGKGDYSGKQTITFVIQPKSIEEEDVTIAGLFAAPGNKVQKPVPVLTWQGKKLKNKTDFTVSYPDENKKGAYQTAGTYKVTVTGTGNYTGTRNLTFTITDKTLLSKAKVNVKAKDYAGSAVTLTAGDITVKVGKDTLVYGKDYTLSYRDNTRAGKATVIVTGTGSKYAGSKEVTFQINGESIAKAQISIADQTYTGTAQTPKVQVQLSGKKLKEGADYTVSYAQAVNAGTAAVTVTGKGSYSGSVKKSYKITAYDLTTLQGVPKNLTTAYTKGGATPTLNLTFNGKTLEAKKDYTVTYKNNKKLATASDAKAPTMIIKGKGNFKGTLTIPFSITVSKLATDGNVTITAADTAYVDKAGKYMVKPVLTDANGKKLTAGTDYEKTFTYTLVGTSGTGKVLTAADTVPVGGKVKVTVTGKGNYKGTLSATYSITKASFSKAKITVTPQTYTGGAVTLSAKDVKVELDGNPLTYGKDYTIVEGSYQNNAKRGTATVTVKGLGNYGGEKNVKFSITAKPFASFLKF